MSDSAKTGVRRRGVAGNAMLLGAGQVATTVLTTVFSAAVARTLGASDYGVLYLLISIATFAYVFVDWGHGPYVIREVALHPERSGDMLGSVLVVRTATILLVGVAAVVLTWLMGHPARTQLLAGLLILAWLPQYLGLTYCWVFRGRERMEYDAIIQVVLKLSMVVLAFAAFALGGGLAALIPVYVGAGAITLVVAIVLYRHVGFPRLQFTAQTARELIRDGAPMLAIALAIAVQPYIDANILYKLAPENVVGWYGAAWMIAGTLVAPATILGAALYPSLSRAASEPLAFRRALRAAFRPLLLLAVYGGVGTYLFADLAISIVYSRQKFGPAADILRAFAPTLLLIYIDMLFGYALLAAGKAGRLAKTKIVAVIVTTVAELILIRWFQTTYGNGGIGIMLAMATGELAMVVGAIYLIRDVVESAMLVDALRAVLAGIVTILVMRMIPGLGGFAGIPVCTVMFAGLSAVVGLVRRSDVDMVLDTVRRRRAPIVAEQTPAGL